MKRKQTLSTVEVVKNATEIFHKNRWNYGIVVCPYCGSIHIKEYDGYRYKCNSCKNRFSDKTNTLLHGSKLSVETWMLGLYEILTTNNISSVELANKLGINQKSAWLLRCKVDYCMKFDDVKLSGDIAQDEMYVGGCLSNYHYGRKIRLLREERLMGKEDKRYTKSAIYALNSRLKTPVFAMNDGKQVVMYATPNPIKSEYIHTIFKKHVVGDSVVISDESKLYNDWEEVTGTKLYTNNHHNNQYITDNGLTSNRIENTFSWFKRGYGGRITHCKYIQLYLNEFCFRANTKGLSTEEKFGKMIGMMGKKVTYNDIKQSNSMDMFPVKNRKRRNITTEEDMKRIFNEMTCIVEWVKPTKDGKKYTEDDLK